MSNKRINNNGLNLSFIEQIILFKLGKIYRFLLEYLERSNLATKIIFKIPVWRIKKKINFDITTLTLKKAIDKNISDNENKILDMGCGQIAILSQYMKKKHPSNEIVAADIYGAFVENSIFNAKKNNLNIKVLKSNLYQNITGKYDYIIFNPPYVPNVSGTKLKYKKQRYSGKDGLYITRRFLSESDKYLNRNGKIFLGINCFYIKFNDIKDIIEGSNMKIQDIVSRKFNTSRAFILENGWEKNE